MVEIELFENVYDDDIHNIICTVHIMVVCHLIYEPMTFMVHMTHVSK